MLPVSVKLAAGRASETRTTVGKAGADRPTASMTFNVFGNCPATVGVPASTPWVSSVRPMASGGPSDHASGATPSLAVNWGAPSIRPRG